MNAYLWLAAAVATEVAGTLNLARSEQFTRLGPSILVVIFYALSFYMLAGALRTIPVGIAYGIWSGLGTSLVALSGWALLGQRLDAPALIGLGMIVGGVVVIQAFSEAGH